MAGQDVYVVGGGNSAGQAALHLARFAPSVTLAGAGGPLAAGMSDYLVQELERRRTSRSASAPGWSTASAARRLEGLVLRTAGTAGGRRCPRRRLFVLIGAEPRTDWLPTARPRRARAPPDRPRRPRRGRPLASERPPLLLGDELPGVFAAGDVRHGSVKRVAEAVGEGSVAVGSSPVPGPPVTARGRGGGRGPVPFGLVQDCWSGSGW